MEDAAAVARRIVEEVLQPPEEPTGDGLAEAAVAHDGPAHDGPADDAVADAPSRQPAVDTVRVPGRAPADTAPASDPGPGGQDEPGRVARRIVEHVLADHLGDAAAATPGAGQEGRADEIVRGIVASVRSGETSGPETEVLERRSSGSEVTGPGEGSGHAVSDGEAGPGAASAQEATAAATGVLEAAAPPARHDGQPEDEAGGPTDEPDLVGWAPRREPLPLPDPPPDGGAGTGRWLVASLLAAVALAALFPLAVAALRSLVSLG